MLDLTNKKYIPNMVIRTSERAAIMNIPQATASQILPIFTIVPVGKSGDAVLKRIKDMQGEMWPTVPVEIGEAIGPKPGDQPNNAHIFLRSLREPANGFQNWQDFIEANSNLIPTLLIPEGTNDPNEILPQIDRFSELGRGIVIKVKRRHVDANPTIRDVYRGIIREVIRREIQTQVLVVLDYGKIGKFEITQNWCTTIFEDIFADTDPRGFTVSLTGTNFPDNFNGLHDEIRRVQIYERTLFENFFAQNSNKNVVFLYGDYASTRGEFRQTGGPAPARIDFATKTHWVYNRRGFERGHENENSETVLEEKDEGFHNAARALLSDDEVRSEAFNLKGLYGSNMIIEAAEDLHSVKASPVVWTGVRVNLHLYQQAHQSGTDGTTDLEEDFED